MVVARRKPLLSKRHMTDYLDLTKRHLKASDHEKQEETKHIEPFGLSAKWIMLWRCFPVAVTLVRIKGKTNGAKYIEILDENLLRTSDWGEGSPSNRTMNLSTQPRQCRSGFGTSL